jgi:predicted HNH restriction endonuclease
MPYKDLKVRKAKQKDYAAKHYKHNTEKVKARAKASNKVYKAKWREFKNSLSCVECGMNHPGVLDFHHIDPEMKNASVHKLIQAKRYGKALEETQQCLVLCANCHRIFHYNERSAAKKKKGAEAP